MEKERLMKQTTIRLWVQREGNEVMVHFGTKNKAKGFHGKYKSSSEDINRDTSELYWHLLLEAKKFIEAKGGERLEPEVWEFK